MTTKLFQGDCFWELMCLESNSVDALVTDPPAGIGFMGKEWDHHKGGRKQWVAWMTEVMCEAYRVMKPGAHGLVWALPRTSHWTATALEDAGFEVRDVVTHLFGSGFPKSLDVSKAIDKAAGIEREVIGQRDTMTGSNKETNWKCSSPRIMDVTAPATDAAKKWQGWGTALKPASEHWILVRKPCSEKTVAANVLKWGTGALNIDGSRIACTDKAKFPEGIVSKSENNYGAGQGLYGDRPRPADKNTQGRFPANLVLSEGEAVEMLDAQSGKLHARGNIGKSKGGKGLYGHGPCQNEFGAGDSGGASRFFYVAKISKSERNAGADNTHPTVKPKKLMAYLIRMVTPPGGTVLDPFMGSGSTGVAAIDAGFKFVGVEQDEEYFKIAQKRIAHVGENKCKSKTKKKSSTKKSVKI